MTTENQRYRRVGFNEGLIQDDTVLELAESAASEKLGLPPMQVVE